jgi:tRNA (guanine10-N2)-methyltransferase
VAVVDRNWQLESKRNALVATPSMPPQQYLIVFAQAHDDFRVPELLSVAELYGFSLNIENDFDPSRPFGILVLEQEEHVRLLARRCILIK